MPNLTLRPTSNVHSLLSGTGYDVVDEDPANDADYNFCDATGNNQYDIYGWEDPPSGLATSVINSVTIYGRLKREGTTAGGWTNFGFEVRGVFYWSVGRRVGTGWALYSDTWTTNPATGVAWTWTDITNLQAGVKLTGEGGDWWTPYHKCSQLYVVVNYNPIDSTGSIDVLSGSMGVCRSKRHANGFVLLSNTSATGAIANWKRLANNSITSTCSLASASKIRYRLVSFTNCVTSIKTTATDLYGTKQQLTGYITAANNLYPLMYNKMELYNCVVTLSTDLLSDHKTKLLCIGNISQTLAGHASLHVHYFSGIITEGKVTISTELQGSINITQRGLPLQLSVTANVNGNLMFNPVLGGETVKGIVGMEFYQTAKREWEE